MTFENLKQRVRNSSNPMSDLPELDNAPALVRVKVESPYEPSFTAMGYDDTADLRRLVWEETAKRKAIDDEEKTDVVLIYSVEGMRRNMSMNNIPALQRQLTSSPVTASEIATPGGFRRDYLGLHPGQSSILGNVSMRRAISSFLEDRAEEIEILFAELVDSDESDVSELRGSCLDEPIHAYKKRKGSKDGSKGASFKRSMVTFFKGFVGPMVLLLPGLFRRAGSVFGSISLAFIAVVETYAILLLVDLSDQTGLDTFAGISRKAAGRWGKRMIDFSLFTSQLSFCITGLVFTRRSVMAILEKNGIQSETWVIMIIATAICTCLTWIRSMKTLGAAMFFVNIFIVVSLIMILIAFGIELGNHPSYPLQVVHLDQVIPFLTTSISTFEGVGIVLPIRRAMEHKKDFPRVITLNMTFLTIFYVLFSLLGVATFGPEVKDFVVMNVNFRTYYGCICRGFYAAGVLLTFPLALFPSVEIAERLILKRFVFPKNYTPIHPEIDHYWTQNLIRSCLGISCGLIAYFAGGSFFQTFLSLAGALCALPLALIYPVFFYIKISTREISIVRHYIHYAIIAFGLVSVFLSILNALGVI